MTTCTLPEPKTQTQHVISDIIHLQASADEANQVLQNGVGDFVEIGQVLNKARAGSHCKPNQNIPVRNVAMKPEKGSPR